jgi:predicted transcriptional regulator
VAADIDREAQHKRVNDEPEVSMQAIEKYISEMTSNRVIESP